MEYVESCSTIKLKNYLCLHSSATISLNFGVMGRRQKRGLPHEATLQHPCQERRALQGLAKTCTAHSRRSGTPRTLITVPILHRLSLVTNL